MTRQTCVDPDLSESSSDPLKYTPSHSQLAFNHFLEFLERVPLSSHLGPLLSSHILILADKIYAHARIYRAAHLQYLAKPSKISNPEPHPVCQDAMQIRRYDAAEISNLRKLSLGRPAEAPLPGQSRLLQVTLSESWRQCTNLEYLRRSTVQYEHAHHLG